jgi:hypothetical protein
LQRRVRLKPVSQLFQLPERTFAGTWRAEIALPDVYMVRVSGLPVVSGSGDVRQNGRWTAAREMCMILGAGEIRLGGPSGGSEPREPRGVDNVHREVVDREIVFGDQVVDGGKGAKPVCLGGGGR